MNDALTNEIEALRSIYTEDDVEIVTTRETPPVVVLVRLKFTKPLTTITIPCETYPVSSAPSVLFTGKIDDEGTSDPFPSITEIFTPGEEVLFRYIEMVREWSRSRREKEEEEEQMEKEIATPPKTTPIPRSVMISGGIEPTILPNDIIVSAPVVEKKSKFIGFCYYTSDVRAVLAAVSMMRSHPLVKGNTHLMYAYKVVDSNGVVRCDNNDDGEDGAGACLAELIFLLKRQNLIVFVARWFGGIELGPLRFKLIKSVAREAIMGGNP